MTPDASNDGGDQPPGAIARAASISIWRCSHGTIFLRLHDETGRVFAAGGFGAQVGLAILGDLAQHINAALAATAMPPPANADVRH